MATSPDSIDIAEEEYEKRGWGGRDRMVAAMSIMRAQDLVRARYAEVLKPFNLTFSRYEALLLIYLSEAGTLPLSKTSSALNVHQASITYTIDRLEADGLVQRDPHPVDRRTTFATITKQGRKVAVKATQAVIESGHGLKELDDEHVGRIVDALAELREPARMGSAGARSRAKKA